MTTFYEGRRYAAYFVRLIVALLVIALIVWIVISTIRFAQQEAQNNTKPASTKSETNPKAKDDSKVTQADIKSNPDSQRVTIPDELKNPSKDTPPLTFNTTDTSNDEDLPKTGPEHIAPLGAGLLSLAVIAHLTQRRRLKTVLLDHR